MSEGGEGREPGHGQVGTDSVRLNLHRLTTMCTSTDPSDRPFGESTPGPGRDDNASSRGERLVLHGSQERETRDHRVTRYGNLFSSGGLDRKRPQGRGP